VQPSPSLALRWQRVVCSRRVAVEGLALVDAVGARRDGLRGVEQRDVGRRPAVALVRVPAGAVGPGHRHSAVLAARRRRQQHVHAYMRGRRRRAGAGNAVRAAVGDDEDRGLVGVDLGFGHIVVSEIDAPILFVKYLV
jgi:hypothetical protein